MSTVSSKFTQLFLMLFLCCSLMACKQSTTNFSSSQLQMVKDSVRIMAESIAVNVSQDGPVAWLKAFDNSPDFFMANDGQFVFANYDSAASFINRVLIKNIRSIQLKWSSMRIEPFTQNLASFAANYQENITDTAGKTKIFIGYFTGIAKQTPSGWKLHNAHWSAISGK